MIMPLHTSLGARARVCLKEIKKWGGEYNEIQKKKEDSRTKKTKNEKNQKPPLSTTVNLTSLGN